MLLFLVIVFISCGINYVNIGVRKIVFCVVLERNIVKVRFWNEFFGGWEVFVWLIIIFEGCVIISCGGFLVKINSFLNV